MDRIALDSLSSWADSKQSKPLILRGARQVGKSTLVRMLAQQKNLDLLEVNLEKKTVHEFEDEDDFDIEKVIKEIELITRKKCTENALIFIDEIQAQPKALNALRYFYEDRPGTRVIAAGSLLETVLHKENYRMPVGRVEYYYLGPMTFPEFLMAQGEDLLLERLEKLTLYSPPDKTLHNQAVQKLKEYYFVGGMPEVVASFINNHDYQEVRDIQNSLIQTYRDDIPRYAYGAEQSNTAAVFEYASAHLGEKVVYSHVARKNSAYIKKAIELLSKANVVHRACHNTCSGLPLRAGRNCDILKLYLLDIGIYNAMLDTEWSDIFQLEPKELMTKGKMAEQFVAQHLIFRHPKKEISELSYWLRDRKMGAAEVDFIISEGSTLYPLEVKSGASGKMRSLWQLLANKPKFKTALRLDLSQRKNSVTSEHHKVTTSKGVVSVSAELIGLPLYAVHRLGDFLLEYSDKKQ